MLLANQLAGGMPLRVQGMPERVNATAYGVREGRCCNVAIFNKDALWELDLVIRGPREIKSVKAWRLQAPALDSTEGVTLAGAVIGERGTWSPQVIEDIALSEGTARIHVPAASAVRLCLR
jgi:hypothetical protein